MKITQLIRSLHRDESGQDLLEYGLLIALITAAIVTTVSLIGTKVHAFYTAVENGIKAP